MKIKIILLLLLPHFSIASEKIDTYFYDIVFLNGLTLSDAAVQQCDLEKKSLSQSRLAFCKIFEELLGKKVSVSIYKDKIYETNKMDDSVFSIYNDEDFSKHLVNSYTKYSGKFKAIIDTASYVSIANIEPNIFRDNFSFKLIYRDKISAGLALVDMNTDIAGIENKILLTQERDIGILGVDFIGQYDRFSFYPNGIWIQPEDISCTDKCVSYDADFDGENLHFFYPLNGDLKRVSFETGSSISSVPFSVADNCIQENIDFSELEERGLDVGDKAKLCKKEFKFGDYSMHSSVVTNTSREIDGEPLPVMGMNMINAFDHVTIDLPAGKIYFYHH